MKNFFISISLMLRDVGSTPYTIFFWLEERGFSVSAIYKGTFLSSKLFPETASAVPYINVRGIVELRQFGYSSPSRRYSGGIHSLLRRFLDVHLQLRLPESLNVMEFPLSE